MTALGTGYANVDYGYSNVTLTLDDKHKQHAMFIAEAEPTGADLQVDPRAPLGSFWPVL